MAWNVLETPVGYWPIPSPSSSHLLVCVCSPASHPRGASRSASRVAPRGLAARTSRCLSQALRRHHFLLSRRGDTFSPAGAPPWRRHPSSESPRCLAPTPTAAPWFPRFSRAPPPHRRASSWRPGRRVAAADPWLPIGVVIPSVATVALAPRGPCRRLTVPSLCPVCLCPPPCPPSAPARAAHRDPALPARPALRSPGQAPPHRCPVPVLRAGSRSRDQPGPRRSWGRRGPCSGVSLCAPPSSARLPVCGEAQPSVRSDLTTRSRGVADSFRRLCAFCRTSELVCARSFTHASGTRPHAAWGRLVWALPPPCAVGSLLPAGGGRGPSAPAPRASPRLSPRPWGRAPPGPALRSL